jgi:recombination protein RecA
MAPSRRRKLDLVVSGLQLKYGPQAIRRAAATEAAPAVARVPTAFPALDTALQGGWPRGRLSELCGPVTSGKLTLAAKAIAALHQADAQALAAWLDTTRTCDPDYLHRCGVALDRLLVAHAATLADALALILHLVESNTLGFLAVDALPAQPAADATLSAGLARLVPLAARTATAVLFLSETPTAHPCSAGAPALAHAAAVRVCLRREQWLTRGPDVRGYAGQAEVIKNRFGPTGVRVPVRIVFNGTVRGEGL